MIKLRNGFSIILFIMLLLPLSSMLPAVESVTDEQPVQIFSPMAVADAYEDDDSFETSKEIALNTKQIRSIYPIADPDFVNFTLDTFNHVTVTIDESAGDTRMWLYDRYHTPILFDDNTGDDLNATISYNHLKPGIYYLKIEEAGNDAEIDDYSLTVSATEVTDPYEWDGCGGHTFMTFNTSISKSITPVGDWDFFEFTIIQNYNITIETFGGPSGDTVIDLRTVCDDDSSRVGGEFAFNDDKGDGTLFSKMEYTNLVPGSYYAKVWGWDDTHTAENYSLHLTAYSSAVSDTTSPVITALNTTFSEPYGPYGANIDVISHDAYGIEKVKLFYRVNYGGWNNYSMYKGSFDHYLTAIGNFAEGDFVQYYFTSEDSSSNHNVRTSDNGGSYYSFTVNHNDLTGPTITNVHHEPVAPNETEVVTFNCIITDPNGIQYATLHYRINGGGWLGHSLNLDINDHYLATRGPFTDRDFVEYYISAADNSTQSNIGTNDNSGSYYSFTVLSDDDIPPAITNINHSPLTPTELDMITFSCNATDANGISAVYLYYRVNGGSWVPQSMSHTTGDNYSRLITSFNYDDVIEYWVRAVDNSSNLNAINDDNGGSFYTFTISSSDTTGPTISAVSFGPPVVYDTDTITVNCSVFDPSDVLSVIIYYSINSGPWQPVGMIYISETNYTAFFGPFSTGDNVHFFIRAYDNSPAQNYAIDDNSGNYYSFYVSESTPTEPLPVTIFIPLVAAFAILLLKRKKK